MPTDYPFVGINAASVGINAASLQPRRPSNWSVIALELLPVLAVPLLLVASALAPDSDGVGAVAFPLVLAPLFSGGGWMRAGYSRTGWILLFARGFLLLPLFLLTAASLMVDCFDEQGSVPCDRSNPYALGIFLADVFVLFGVPIISACILGIFLRRRQRFAG